MQTTRCAVVGTAESWVKTPWDDPSLYIVSLNDAYALGLPRFDEWWEVHPFDKMWFKPNDGSKVVRAEDVPPGAYIRPAGHLDWLREQAKAIPVWLQQEPPADWPPLAQRVPIEELERRFGTYWASGPAYMIAHLYARGFREFHIYGIHLSTEAEYREQRPQLEMLLGRLLGVDEWQESRDDAKGLRTYRGAGVTVVLPVESPILQHGWRYAYEPKPAPATNPYAVELKSVQARKVALMSALVRYPDGPTKTQALEELEDLEVAELDCRQMLGRRRQSGTLTASLGA